MLAASNVVGGHAVQDGMRAGRIVSDHPADRGTVGAGRVGTKHEVVALQFGIELLQHDAGLNTGRSCGGVDLENLIQVLRCIDHQRPANGLSGQAAPAASRKDGQVVLRGKLDRGPHVINGARQDDTQRFYLIVAGVGAVEHAAVLIEASFAADAPGKFGLERLDHLGFVRVRLFACDHYHLPPDIPGEPRWGDDDHPAVP